MAKIIYTETELQEFEDHGVVPEGVDLTPFCEMVAELCETMGQVRGFGFQQHPRKPRRKRQPKEIVGEDGWTSMVTKKHDEQDEEEDDGFQQVKSFKPSAAKISSGKAGTADSKDTVAVSNVSRFNAFDALNDDDDE